MKANITIDGKKYPMLFGMGALIMFCKDKGIEVYQFDERFKDVDPDKLTVQYMEDFAHLILCSIKNAMRKDPEPVKLDYYDVFEWMSSGSKEVERVKQLFFEGKIVKGEPSGNSPTPVKQPGKNRKK